MKKLIGFFIIFIFSSLAPIYAQSLPPNEVEYVVYEVYIDSSCHISKPKLIKDKKIPRKIIKESQKQLKEAIDGLTSSSYPCESVQGPMLFKFAYPKKLNKKGF